MKSLLGWVLSALLVVVIMLMLVEMVRLENEVTRWKDRAHANLDRVELVLNYAQTLLGLERLCESTLERCIDRIPPSVLLHVPEKPKKSKKRR